MDCLFQRLLGGEICLDVFGVDLHGLSLQPLISTKLSFLLVQFDILLIYVKVHAGDILVQRASENEALLWAELDAPLDLNLFESLVDSDLLCLVNGLIYAAVATNRGIALELTLLSGVPSKIWGLLFLFEDIGYVFGARLLKLVDDVGGLILMVDILSIRLIVM